MRRRSLLPLFLVLICIVASAKKEKEEPSLVMFWPSQETATLKLTFSRFQNMGSYAGQMSLVSAVIVQNLSPKLMPRASFSVALLDKDKVRVGNGVLIVDDLNPGESARVQFQCTSVGVPVQLSISARNTGGVPTSLKTIPLNVISVPAGASLKVDGKDEGITPVRINVTAGTHQLELRKEGFAIATTPLDVGPNEAPGGSITITLGGLANDTIELRDGSILTGDVISMSLESVVINVSGSEQTFDRNKIKKIFLVERTVTHITVPEAPAKANPPAIDSPPPHP
jgi:hypothetical protein